MIYRPRLRGIYWTGSSILLFCFFLIVAFASSGGLKFVPPFVLGFVYKLFAAAILIVVFICVLDWLTGGFLSGTHEIRKYLKEVEEQKAKQTPDFKKCPQSEIDKLEQEVLSKFTNSQGEQKHKAEDWFEQKRKRNQ